MKRKHKQYSRPKRPFDKARIEEEAIIVKEYGLKNKKELWKAEAKIKIIREKAKKLVGSDEKERQELFDKLNKIGLKVNSIAEVLSLDKKDYLNRRLQTIVAKKRLVPTTKTARQMIVHKKVLVDGKVINIPSKIIPMGLENKITLKISKKSLEPKEKKLVKKIKDSEKSEPKEEIKEDTK